MDAHVPITTDGKKVVLQFTESSANFKQYIDTMDPKDTMTKYNLTTLDQHWNSEYMKM